jgi:hypothetical protein
MKLIPLAITILCAIIMFGGLIGYTITGEVEDIPVPQQGIGVGISPDPLQEMPVSSWMVSAKAEITWNADVWVGVIDETQAASCEGIINTCSGSSMDFVAGGTGTQSSRSLTWQVSSGTYYAAAGQATGSSPAATFDASYEIKVKLAWPILILAGLIGTGAAAMTFPGMRI